MRPWTRLLSGLLLWAAHFFAVYGISSIWPGSTLARLLVAAVTAVLLAAAWWLLVRTIRRLATTSDATDRWLQGLEVAGLTMSSLAIVFQGLPAVF